MKNIHITKKREKASTSLIRKAKSIVKLGQTGTESKDGLDGLDGVE